MSEEAYCLNPQAQLRLTMTGPLREHGYRTLSCELTEDLLAGLAIIKQQGDISLLSPQIRILLEEMGLIVPQRLVSNPVVFSPWILARWPDLMPYKHRYDARRWPALRLNPTLSREAPDAWLSSDLPAGLNSVWIKSRSALECSLPFWLDPSLKQQLLKLSENPKQEMGPETSSEASLVLNSEPLRTLLATACLLVPTLQSPLELYVRQVCAAARTTLESKGYAVVRRVLNPLHIAAMRQYLRALSQEGYFEQGSTQVKLRDVRKNDQVLVFLHKQLAELVNLLVAEPVKPSYCLLAIYYAEAELRKHTDRSQCAWNISLVLDMDPECEQTEAWPIYIEHMGKIHPIKLEMGDLILYRGSETPHWRPPLPRGQQVSVGLFHFVPLEFNGSLD